MNKKSFFLGAATGIVLTIAVLLVVELINRNSADDEPIQYLENPETYENKSETSFQVFQVIGDAALASEISSEELGLYLGTTVLLLGENYYSDQVVKMENPQIIGTYSYTSKGGRPMTVPVLEGTMEE